MQPAGRYRLHNHHKHNCREAHPVTMETIDAAALAAVLREAVTDPLAATFRKAMKKSTTTITTTMEAGFGKTHDLLEMVLLQKAGDVKPIRAAATSAIVKKKKKEKKRSNATTGFCTLYPLKGKQVNMSNLTMEEGNELVEAAAAEFAIIKPVLEAGAADSNPAYAAAGPPATDVTREEERFEPIAAWLTAVFHACGGINLQASAWRRAPPRHSVPRHYHCVKIISPADIMTLGAALELLQYAMAIGVQRGRGTTSLIGATDGCTAFISVCVDVNAHGVPTVSLNAPADLPLPVAAGASFEAVLEAVLCLTEQLKEEADNRARLATGLAVFLGQCRRLPLPAPGDGDEDDVPAAGGAGGGADGTIPVPVPISGAKRRRSGHGFRIKVSAEKVARVASRLGPASAALLTLATAAGIPASRSSLALLADEILYLTPVAAAAPAIPAPV